MLDRLVELLYRAHHNASCVLYEGGSEEEILEEEARYLLKYGVIVPPCKVGDIIYALTYDRNDYMPLKVTSRESLVRWMDEGQFGHELFITREEAEQALLKP